MATVRAGHVQHHLCQQNVTGWWIAHDYRGIFYSHFTEAVKMVIYKQRYHQTTHLKAESVTQKSLNLVTCSLARPDLFPAHV